jgi:hypothetical protein
MNKIYIISIFILFNRLHAETNYNQEIQNAIYSDLIEYKKEATRESLLYYANIFFPSKEELETHQVTDTELISDAKRKCWIPKYICNSTKNLICLKDMNNGDDWIIGSHIKNGKYIQYIDGRALTVLIKLNEGEKINIKNENCQDEIFSKINGLIFFNSLYLTKNSRIEITKRSEKYIEGYFDKTYTEIGKYKKDLIWTNGEYIILEIIKIMYPSPSFKYPEMYLYEDIINGIPHNDSRRHIRFSRSNNVDLKEEMHRIFHWIQDSVEYYRTTQKELYGKTPSYIINNTNLKNK